MTSPQTVPALSQLQSTTIGAMLVPMFRRLGLQSVYLLTGMPIAIVAFVLVVTGLSLGVGLAITLIGLPVLVGSIFVARGFATLERLKLHHLMAIDSGGGHYRRTSEDNGPLKRALTPLADLQSWLDVAHAIIMLPVAIITWTVALTWWVTAIAGTTWALWGWTTPSDSDNTDLPELLGLGSSYVVRAGFYTLLGLLCLLSLPWVIALAANASAAVGRLLLIAPSSHRGQVDRLRVGRDATRAAEESSLRRLERDIHDGPQQRLVRLSMDLGRAQQKVDPGSAELAEALSDAKRQTQETLDELRALSRGIAPPILADRGLQSALEELAAGAVIPTYCSIDLGPERLAPYAETAVYFVVAEALTNATKHSNAEGVWIDVTRNGNSVLATVIDDGVGGAHPSKGHGLAGLMERVVGADGKMAIESPIGGPTRITAEIPCG